MHFAHTQSRRWSNNTYYCFGATDKYSTKGLSKRHNIDKDTFLTVLTNRRRMGNIKEFQDREHTISEVSTWRSPDIDKDTFLTVLTNRRRMGNIKEFQDREHTISEVSREEMDMEKPWWKH